MSATMDEDAVNFEAFKTKYDLQEKAKKADQTKRAGEKQQVFVQKLTRACRALRRLQYYLGVVSEFDVPESAEQGLADPFSSLPLDKLSLNGDETSFPQQEKVNIEAKPHGLSITFVSVDCEAFEHKTDLITEVGISTLDLDDLYGRQPDVRARGWVSKIHSRHFRVKDYKHLVNKTFLQGCPEKFAFGKSEWVYAEDMKKVIEDVFRKLEQQQPKRERRIVLVGHNVNSDLKWLQKLGIDLSASLFDCLDTEEISRALLRDSKSVSLTRLLLHCHIGAQYLHNAGNDARYTLEALLAVGIMEGVSESQLEVEKAERIRIACEEVTQRINLEYEGWKSAFTEIDQGIVSQEDLIEMEETPKKTTTEALIKHLQPFVPAPILQQVTTANSSQSTNSLTPQSFGSVRGQQISAGGGVSRGAASNRRGARSQPTFAARGHAQVATPGLSATRPVTTMLQTRGGSSATGAGKGTVAGRSVTENGA